MDPPIRRDDVDALRALTLATRTAAAMFGPGDDARDVAQEVVLRVLERRSQLRDPTKFDAWEDADHARSALARLGERERLAMVLRYVHDLSDRQIAAAMRCRRGTVNSLLSRARARLRELPEVKALATTANGTGHDR